ncbi:MAG: hypothetical protein Q9M31_06790 [Mariprofundus sp.]|nr:hypothetical protein [Mariprofundus sp.]
MNTATALAFDDKCYTPISFGFETNSEPNEAIIQLRKIQQQFLESNSFGLRKEPLRQEVAEVYADCNEENWDGCEAIAIAESTYDEVIRLVEGLPSNIPLPSPSPEPTGEICLEWYSHPRCVFSISVNSTSTITYAGLFGYETLHGTVFYGQSLPKVVIENISRITA